MMSTMHLGDSNRQDNIHQGMSKLVVAAMKV